MIKACRKYFGTYIRSLISASPLLYKFLEKIYPLQQHIIIGNFKDTMDDYN